MINKIISILLRLDGPILKSDNYLTKKVKSKILKPIGCFFRKMYFNKNYK